MAQEPRERASSERRPHTHSAAAAPVHDAQKVICSQEALRATSQGTENGHGPIRPALKSKTLLVTTCPSDRISGRNAGDRKDQRKRGQKLSEISVRFWAEPETMVPAVGGAETGKEATGDGKGLTMHMRTSPVCAVEGRGCRCCAELVGNLLLLPGRDKGKMAGSSCGLRLCTLCHFQNVFKLFGTECTS